ncbi:uncharacterized protein LOC110985381 [Acanthaster planci]|uniref:Uncharacterized protein LOC110985381 n=1 Tax=Acanthaster planci TaxID=133434 RepID=A0A8B7ZB59_ACAPL|nr:uncharacterized protein LOC110985381 [Acanthaster planci]
MSVVSGGEQSAKHQDHDDGPLPGDDERQEESVRPEDSSSQIASTTSTTKSSLGRTRRRLVAKMAALEAEAACLREIQVIELEELKLRQRKQELAIKTKMDMAKAEEIVYAIDGDSLQTTPPSLTPSPVLSDKQESQKDSLHEAGDEQTPRKEPGYSPVDSPSITTPKNGEHSADKLKTAPMDDDNPEKEASLMELVKTGQQQQRCMLATMQLPRAELPTFDGNPLQYWTFLRAFENSVDIADIDDSAKLVRLLKYCTGKARKIIECCAIMAPSVGYKRAKALLQERFGSDYVIAEAWVNKVTKGVPLASHDKVGLREYADDLKVCKETLDTMGYIQEIGTQGVMVKLVEKLPGYLRNRWIKLVRGLRKSDKCPKIADLVEFVEDAAQEANDPVYSNLHASTYKPHRPEMRSRVTRPDKTSYALSTISKMNEHVHVTCVMCKGNHTLFGCSEFKGKTPQERFNFAKAERLCYNCLRPGHVSSACSLHRVCSVAGCGKRHTKFLHPLKQTPSSGVEDDRPAGPEATAQSSFTETDHGTSCVTGVGVYRVALPIIAVKVSAVDGDCSVDTYALLDNGSTSSFCTEELACRLSIKGKRQSLTLTTMTKAKVKTETTVVSLVVNSFDQQAAVKLDKVYTRHSLPINDDNIAEPEDITKWPHLRDISIPQVEKGKVHLLIGQDSPEALLPLEVRSGETKAPYATRTRLGWSLNGPLGMSMRPAVTSSYVAVDDALEQQLQRFWKLDAAESLYDDDKGMSVQDKRAIALWESTVCMKDGHYELPIPFKNNPPRLADNRMVAEQRLTSLGRRLERDHELKSRYIEGMKNLVDNGYAEALGDDCVTDTAIWYLPHHPVLDSGKQGKMRIVFDCAAKHHGQSLNTQTISGPDLTNKLLGVLLRFRQEQVAVLADVRAMFHQVRVSPECRDVLRYLWWPDGDTSREPAVHRMTAHPFGGTWSPSCCSFALRHTAEDNRHEFQPDTVNCVMRNFYVDDCLVSLATEVEAIRVSRELRELLSRGGFQLTKWLSNSPQVLESTPQEDRAVGVRGLDLNHEALPTERALGMQWDVETDCFGYKVSQREKPLTRRGLLSIVSSIYDPHGFASPFTLLAKKIVQDLSRKKLGWDEELPSQHREDWQRWKQDLGKLEQLRINRCIKPYGYKDGVSYQLHHFSDASEAAYGAVTYLRMVNSAGLSHTCLLLSKSRLAPLKKVTIPRLELTAATLSVRLDAMIKKEFDLPLEESVFWTDSTIVLRYIYNEQKRFHTFVANRVAVIQNQSSFHQWRHVKSGLNPADVITRGQMVDELLANQEWLIGPEFLRQEDNMWPSLPISTTLDDKDPEVKLEKEIVTIYATQHTDSANPTDRLMARHSSWYELRRSVAWILRVTDSLLRRIRKQPAIQDMKTLTTNDLARAEAAIVRYIQAQSFQEEFSSLKKGEDKAQKLRSEKKKKGQLYKLDPILTDDSIIRVGGRLRNAPGDTSNHPPILPKDNHVVSLIMKHYHLESGHSGREYVLSLIRQKFWVIKARSILRKVLSSCFECRRRSVVPVQQKMADLPSDRVTPHRPPFSFVGVDCFGPFLVKQGRNQIKRYGCIFTCLASRAVHIEVLHTLDTDSFINGMQRFVCRRGQPIELRSDNGSNFIGAERELKEAWKGLSQEKVDKFLLKKGIQWKFNPPSASHMGGVWERQIRSTRRLLSSLMTEQVVSDETLSTVMCLVESIINNRPITTVSDDINDLEPLTPNHLLLLRGAPHSLGEFDKKDMYSRRRWKQAQYLADVFWRRWIREYLPSLQKRQKWLEPQRSIMVGDLVLIVDNDLPRNKWLLGRVLETYPGKDQLVRVVKVKTKSSILTRPVQKLCLLESVNKEQ